MTDFRTTTVVAEVWSLATPSYQATEVFAEVWSLPAPAYELTNLFLEMWVPNATVGTRYQATALDIEVWLGITRAQTAFLFIIT